MPPACAGDLQELVDRLLQAIALVADVGDVAAATFACGARQGLELRGLGEVRRRVDERAADPERALAHRLAHEILHARELRAARIAIGLSELVDAHRGGADERGDVWRNAAALQRLQVTTERGPVDVVGVVALLLAHLVLHRLVERPARFTLAEDLQGHALLDVAHPPSVDDQRLGGPGQHVYEAGSDGLAGGIDLRGRARRGEIAERHDPVGADADVGPSPRTPTAVVDHAVPDQDVVAFTRVAQRLRRRTTGQHCENQRSTKTRAPEHSPRSRFLAAAHSAQSRISRIRHTRLAMPQRLRNARAVCATCGGAAQRRPTAADRRP